MEEDAVSNVEQPPVDSLQELLALRQQMAELQATEARDMQVQKELQEEIFDLILCVLRIPELDGPGLYQERAHHQPQPFQRMIFLTGDTLSPKTKEFLERTDFVRLTRPFTAAEVRRVVAQALQEGSRSIAEAC